MSLTHRAMCCLGWIVRISDKHGYSTMGAHRPCDIRALLQAGFIERVTRMQIEERRRNAYRPTKVGLQYFTAWGQS